MLAMNHHKQRRQRVRRTNLQERHLGLRQLRHLLLLALRLLPQSLLLHLTD